MKRTGKNGLEFHVGCSDYPDSKYDTWEPITNLPGSENMIAEFNKKCSENMIAEFNKEWYFNQ